MQFADFSPNSDLEAAIDRQPLITAPKTTLLDAVKLLCPISTTSKNKKTLVNCLLIVEHNRLQGVLSLKDIIAAIANETDISQLQVAEVMKTDAIAVPSSELKNLNFVLRLFGHYRLQELVVIDRDTSSIGVLSALSLCQTIQPTNLLSWKTAGEVMTTQIVRADANVDAIARAKLMTSNNTDYLVIKTSDAKDDFEKIFSDRDLLCGYLWERTENKSTKYFEETLSIQALSCLHREDSLQTIHHKMRLYQQQSLGVIDKTGKCLGVVDRAALLSVLEPQKLYETIQAIQLFPQQFTQLQRQKIEFLESRNLEIEQQAHQSFLQLRQKNSLLQTILDNISAAVLLENERRQILYVNQEFCQLFGLEARASEFEGQNFTVLEWAIASCFVESDRWVFTAPSQQVKGKSFLLADGRVAELDRSVFDLDAEERGYLWQFRIHPKENRRNLPATQSSDRAQAQLQDLLNNATAAIISLRLFENGKWDYDYYSAGCEAVFGYTPQEFMTDKNLWMSRVEPEDLNNVVIPALQATCDASVNNLEYRFHHKNGEIRWISENFTCRNDKNTLCRIYTIVCTNITDRKQLELALANSQAKLSDILNNAIAAISSFRVYSDRSVERDYYSAGSEQIFGYTAEEFMSDPQLWYSRIPPEDLKNIILPAFEQIFSQTTITIEYRFLDKEKNIRWIADTFSSRQNEAENCWTVTSYTIDISKRKQAELALKESEALLSVVFKRSVVGVALSDFNGRLLKTNPSFQEMLGYEKRDLQNLHFAELTHEDDLAKSEALFAELIQGKRDLFQIEKRYYRKNGEIIWVRKQVSLVVSHYNRTPLAIAFVENITESKQAELALQKLNEELELRVQERTQELTRSQEALQNQTNLLQTILDSIGDGLLVADTEGQFLIFNPSAERILKMGSIDLSALNWSTNASMYMSDRVTPYPAEQLPLYKAVRGEAIDDAEIFIPNPETLEGIWLSITSRPIKDRTGKILGGVLTFRNTTERRLMEEALRQRETEFRTLVENSPDIIARLDSQLRHLYINPAIQQISRLSRMTIIGKTYRELDLPQDSIALLEESGRSVFATGQEKIIEFCLPTSHGEKYFQVRIVPELAADGTVSSILTISPDITSIKEAESQIKASLKEKEVLLKEIHHRVKNNLYVVASLLELQTDSLDEPQVVELFEDSQQRIYSMALIHEKLYRSQNLAQINFGDYLEDLVTNLFASYNLQEKRIQLSINAEPVYLNIETATPCGLIVNELVSNTIKHAFPDNREGSLTVEFYRDRHQNLNLVVSDDGIGFPKELDFNSTNSMGLQVICTLTEQLEATIQLDRTKGTTFLLQFSELHYNKRF